MRQSTELEQLKALLEKSEREKLELIRELNKAHSHASTTGQGFDVPSSNYQASPSANPSLASNGRPRSSTIPSGATNGPGSRPIPVQQDQSRPMKRSKTTHAPGFSADAPMMRSKSSVSRQDPTQAPFTSNVPPRVPNPNPLGGSLDHSQLPYPAAPASSMPTGTLQHGGFGREIPFHELFMLRDEDLFSVTSPISIPNSALISPYEPEQFPASNLPSVCGSMSSGPTLETAPMSRCNSSMNDNMSISGQFSDMVRIQSQHSTRSHVRADSLQPSPIAVHPALLGKRLSDAANVIALPKGAFSYGLPSSTPVDPAQAQHQHPMEPSMSQSSIRSTSSAGFSPHDLSNPHLNQHLAMERSLSKDSIKSNSSWKLRAKEALARQNHAAKSRHLQPKPVPGAPEYDVTAPVSGSAKDGKAVIMKTKYERPKHPKVMCNQCSEHPEGFRGEHELRRHTEAKHKSMVKKWICRDPDVYGIAHAEKAVKALKDCKQCSQSKQYGAYYNAAAHLRRTHFKVKPRKVSTGKKGASKAADEEREKRGGKGGGDWPSMNELKLWMVEVTVPMDQAGALVPDGSESVAGAEADDFENEFPESQYAHQAGEAIPTGPDGYDVAAFAGVGGGFAQAIDLAGTSFQGDLDAQLLEMYSTSGPFSASPHGIPASSSGFDYGNAHLGVQQVMPPSFIHLGDHEYGSSVSPTATVMPAAMFGEELVAPVALQRPRDDLPDLPFELTFTAGCQ